MYQRFQPFEVGVQKCTMGTKMYTIDLKSRRDKKIPKKDRTRCGQQNSHGNKRVYDKAARQRRTTKQRLLIIGGNDLWHEKTRI